MSVRIVPDVQRITQGPNNSYTVHHTDGTKMFIPPLVLKPLPPSKPFQRYITHGFVKETGVQGHTLPSFSWNNMDDVKQKRFAKDTKVPSQIINSPQDQGNCGSCWIVSAVTMTSDRLAISTLTNPQKLDIVDLCCNGQDGCDGADTATAFQSMYHSRLRPEKCNLYNQWCAAGYHCQSAVSSRVKYALPECTCKGAPDNNACAPIATVDADSFVAFYVPLEKRVQVVQDEIFENGPVVVGFTVTDALIARYTCKQKNDAPFDGSGNPLGGHAVVIVGWGPDYWVVRNSWGTSWNGDGYWKYNWNAGLEDSGTFPPTSWTAQYISSSASQRSVSLARSTEWLFVLIITAAAVVLLTAIVWQINHK